MKPVKRVDLSELNPDQRAAFAAFAADCATYAPQMKALQDTAKTVFTQMIRAPQWRIVQAEHDGTRPQETVWHVGAPQVNYVDHIEGAP